MDLMAGEWFSKSQDGGHRCYFQCEGISWLKMLDFLFIFLFLKDTYLD